MTSSSDSDSAAALRGWNARRKRKSRLQRQRRQTRRRHSRLQEETTSRPSAAAAQPSEQLSYPPSGAQATDTSAFPDDDHLSHHYKKTSTPFPLPRVASWTTQRQQISVVLKTTQQQMEPMTAASVRIHQQLLRCTLTLSLYLAVHKQDVRPKPESSGATIAM